MHAIKAPLFVKLSALSGVDLGAIHSADLGEGIPWSMYATSRVERARQRGSCLALIESVASCTSYNQSKDAEALCRISNGKFCHRPDKDFHCLSRPQQKHPLAR